MTKRKRQHYFVDMPPYGLIDKLLLKFSYIEGFMYVYVNDTCRLIYLFIEIIAQQSQLLLKSWVNQRS